MHDGQDGVTIVRHQNETGVMCGVQNILVWCSAESAASPARQVLDGAGRPRRTHCSHQGQRKVRVQQEREHS